MCCIVNGAAWPYVAYSLIKCFFEFYLQKVGQNIIYLGGVAMFTNGDLGRPR